MAAIIATAKPLSTLMPPSERCCRGMPSLVGLFRPINPVATARPGLPVILFADHWLALWESFLATLTCLAPVGVGVLIRFNNIGTSLVTTKKWIANALLVTTGTINVPRIWLNTRKWVMVWVLIAKTTPRRGDTTNRAKYSNGKPVFGVVTDRLHPLAKNTLNQLFNRAIVIRN